VGKGPRASINAPGRGASALISPATSVKLFDPEENAAVLPGGLILALDEGAIDGVILDGEDP
jgi:hypothetical protein